MASTSAAVKQLSDGNSQGTCLGQSATDLISFYGATPVARLAGGLAVSTLTMSTVLATATAPASGGISMTTFGWVYTSAAQANAVITGVNQCITDVTALWGVVRQLRGHAVSTGLFTGS